MKQQPGGGNGSGKFEIGHHDMGGWVRVCASRHNLPDDLPVYLSQVLSDWFRQRPHLRMRCVVPVQRDGDTGELHAWYDAHLFPALQGPAPSHRERPMSTPLTDPALDQRLLSDLYREYRLGWDKLLTTLGLPANIGIVETMTLGEAKAFAAGRGTRKDGDGSQAKGSARSPARHTLACPPAVYRRISLSCWQ